MMNIPGQDWEKGQSNGQKLAWNQARPTSTTDLQNNLTQAALISLCFLSSSA